MSERRDFVSSEDFYDNRPVVISRSEARDFRLYELAKQQAEQRGVPMQVVDDVELDSRMGRTPPDTQALKLDKDGIFHAQDGTRVVPITRSNARDFPCFQKAKAHAERVNGVVRIVPDDTQIEDASPGTEAP